ncbi:ribonuclease H-like domain-containing protein [Tanacetum coccineum]
MTGDISLSTHDFHGIYRRSYTSTFGGGAHGGRISSKETLKTDSLNFEDVYFVNELKFNIFSVSQMCDKKNYVLFTNIECLVLYPNFKLPDESQILLKIPRKDNREKGIKREYSVARTPQQRGVAERRNKTLIEAARTMLADSKLPTTFWAEAVILQRINSKDRKGTIKVKLVQDVENGEPKSAADDQKQDGDGLDNENDEQDKSDDVRSPKEVNAAGQHVKTTSPAVNTGSFKLNVVGPLVNTANLFDQDSPKDMFTMGASHTLEATHVEFFSDEDEPKVDLGNIPNSYTVLTTLNTKIHKDHPIENVIGDEETLQFKLQDVDTLDLPSKEEPIRIKIGLDTTKDEMGIVIRIKASTKSMVYVDDIIFDSTNKDLCTGFEKLMKDKFQMSSMGELTFFLGLQVQQKKMEHLPVRINRPLESKDGDAAVMLQYISRVAKLGPLMYLSTKSRPDNNACQKEGRDTKIPQSSGPPIKVGDEAVHEGFWVNRKERDCPYFTASSLEAEQDMVTSIKTQTLATLRIETSIRSDLYLEDAGDDSQYTYGPAKTQPSEPETQTNELDACDSNISTESSELVFEPVVNESHIEVQPKDNPHRNIQNKGIIDSGCSPHIDREQGLSSDVFKTLMVALFALWRFIEPFFLRTKDETSAILKDFIRQIENQLNQKVKTIRCDNGTEFKNKDVIEFCGLKGDQREYSNATRNSTTKWKLLRERTRPLLRQQGPCLQIHFYLTLFGLKQLVLLAMFLTGQEKEANEEAKALTKNLEQENENLVTQAEAAKTSGTNIISTVSTTAKASGTNFVNTVSIPVGTASSQIEGLSLSNTTNSQEDDYEIPPLEDIHEDATDGIFTHSSYDDEGDPTSAVQTRSKVNKSSEAHAFVSYVQKQRRTNHKDFHHCLFACFLSQHEPKKISEALEDESWVDAMQEELLQFEIQKVWDPRNFALIGKKAIGTKWVYRNKKDERGVVVRRQTEIGGYTGGSQARGGRKD